MAMEAGLPHAAKYAWGHEAPAPTMFFVFMRPSLMRATAGSLLYNSNLTGGRNDGWRWRR